MKSSTPVTIYIIKGILYLEIFIYVLLFGIFFFTKDLNHDVINYWTGVREAIKRRFELTTESTDYAIGYLAGRLIVPTVLSLLTIFFVNRKKFTASWLVATFLFISSFTSGVPFLSLIVLILVITNPAKRYLKNQNIRPEGNRALDSMEYLK